MIWAYVPAYIDDDIVLSIHWLVKLIQLSWTKTYTSRAPREMIKTMYHLRITEKLRGHSGSLSPSHDTSKFWSGGGSSFSSSKDVDSWLWPVVSDKLTDGLSGFGYQGCLGDSFSVDIMISSNVKSVLHINKPNQCRIRNESWLSRNREVFINGYTQSSHIALLKRVINITNQHLQFVNHIETTPRLDPQAPENCLDAANWFEKWKGADKATGLVRPGL